jgi:hypothetical protein
MGFRLSKAFRLKEAEEESPEVEFLSCGMNELMNVDESEDEIENEENE